MRPFIVFFYVKDSIDIKNSLDRLVRKGDGNGFDFFRVWGLGLTPKERTPPKPQKVRWCKFHDFDIFDCL